MKCFSEKEIGGGSDIERKRKESMGSGENSTARGERQVEVKAPLSIRGETQSVQRDCTTEEGSG